MIRETIYPLAGFVPNPDRFSSKAEDDTVGILLILEESKS